MNIRKIIFFFFPFIISTARAQNLQKVEADLVQSFEHIEDWRTRADSDADFYDSLNKANDVFQHLLQHCLESYPGTLHYGFPELQDAGCKILTSADGQFRIYSWDKLTGGTMHYFASVFQCQSTAGIVTRSLPDSSGGNDPSYEYSKLYSLQANHRVYYLAVASGIYSTRDFYDELQVYALNAEGRIDTAQIIRTTSGPHSALGFEYNFFSVYESKERPLRLITYDSTTRTIALPVVLGDGTVTKGRIFYRFNGTQFVKETTAGVHRPQRSDAKPLNKKITRD